ncbi:MAG: ATP-binding protein [Chitinophagales bacterium]
MTAFKPYFYGIIFLFLYPLVFSYAHSTDSLTTVLMEIDNTKEDNFIAVFETMEHPSLKEEELLSLKQTLERIISISQTTSNFSKTSKLYALLAKIHIALNTNKAAFEALQKSIAVGKDFLNNKEQIKILKRTADLSLTMGKYEEAYSYRLQILKVYEKLKDNEGIYSTFYNIGSIFFYQENFPQALEYYQQAHQMAKMAQDSSIIYRSLAAMGSVYGELKDNDKSLAYNFQSLKMAENMNFDMGVAYAAHNVGLNYVLQNQLDTALTYLQQSLDLMRKSKDKFGEANCLQAISGVHSKTQDYTEAIAHLEKALEIHRQLGDRSRIREIYRDLSKAYFNGGNSVKAYQVQKGYIELRDSLVKEETMQQMASLKQTYELEKKESEKQIAIMQKEQQIERMYRYAGLLGLGVLMLVSWLFYSRYQEQTTMNKLLAQKNEEIQLQNNKLATSNRELEQFAYIASHDLKEPLRNIGGFTSLLERRYIEKGDEDAKDFMRFISGSVNHMHKLLTDLLAYSRIGMQEGNHTELLNLNDIIKQVSSNYQTSIKKHNAQIISTNLPTIHANRIQMIQLFQNLIGNAIKFKSEEAPEIHIHCAENTKEFTISVRDNGIGMEQEYTDKIFVIFQRLHNRTKYEGTGIGLSICKKIVEQHDGKIWVESQSGDGSTFYFSIPKTQKDTSTSGSIANRRVMV